MTHGVRQYRKELKKTLRCGYTIRRGLLARWDFSLAGFLEEHPAPTFEEIAAAFGPPEEMAQTLMAELSTADIRDYRLQRRILRLLAGLCVTAFLLFIVYVFVEKQKPIVFIEETYIGLSHEVTEGE